MESVKVLYVSQEITPYLPETEISVISRNLPQGIQEKGREIRTFMPRYGCINERRNQLHEVIRLSGMNIIINDNDHPLIIKVASIQAARMQVYFIDNEDYFQRRHVLKDEKGKHFNDNDERAIFFARGVVETVKKLRWSPDIVHCHGWFTSFVPFYLKTYYKDDPLFSNARVVHSIYNNEFENTFNTNMKEKVWLNGIGDSDLSKLDKPLDYTNLTKFAIDYSDGIILGSEGINNDVLKYIDDNDVVKLDYQSPETYVDEYSDFYDKVLAVEVNEH